MTPDARYSFPFLPHILPIASCVPLHPAGSVASAAAASSDNTAVRGVPLKEMMYSRATVVVRVLVTSQIGCREAFRSEFMIAPLNIGKSVINFCICCAYVLMNLAISLKSGEYMSHRRSLLLIEIIAVGHMFYSLLLPSPLFCVWIACSSL